MMNKPGSQKRALRRHHMKRLKAKRQFYWSGKLTPKEVGKAFRTTTPCSCQLCGNPRKIWKEQSLAERKAKLRLDDLVSELRTAA